MSFIVYTKSSIACPYCNRVKSALAKQGYEFVERDIDNPTIKDELLQRRPNARSVPQVFLLNGYHIGGCDELLALINAGTLDRVVLANSE